MRIGWLAAVMLACSGGLAGGGAGGCASCDDTFHRYALDQLDDTLTQNLDACVAAGDTCGGVFQCLPQPCRDVCLQIVGLAGDETAGITACHVYTIGTAAPYRLSILVRRC
ncbi:MAG TPA: hypothetical protein VNO55_21870 [Polyangia bacterium]|nr:hypothetical protein [Polyangia bacterium]